MIFTGDEKTKMKVINYEVKNPLGIHARPAAILAQACTNFKAAVTIECNGETASGNNVLQILALHAGSALLYELHQGNDCSIYLLSYLSDKPS